LAVAGYAFWQSTIALRSRRRIDVLIEKEIAIKIAPREDGGIRVWSDDLPGLVLSHSNQELVLCDLGKAIIELRRHQMAAAATASAGVCPE
jgi:hypothetical protein